MHESLAGGGDTVLATDLERARPQTLGEEELQLQLALAMSKEESEQEEKLRRNDDIRLQLAISESQKRAAAAAPSAKKSAVDDLLSLTTGMDASGVVTDPWSCLSSGGPALGAVGGAPAPFSGMASDPWSSSSTSVPQSDPWSSSPAAAASDPWQPSPPPNHNKRATPLQDADAWLSAEDRSGVFHHPQCAHSSLTLTFLFPVSAVTPSYGSTSPVSSSQTAIRKTPESFLGPNSNLVNLDALVSTKSTGGKDHDIDRGVASGLMFCFVSDPMCQVCHPGEIHSLVHRYQA
jgi:epsin